jgi:hypothetical protein
MFFDEQVAKPVKADPFSLESLIAWLGTKEPGEKYCYHDEGACLFGQYFKAKGFTDFYLGHTVVVFADHRKSIHFPRGFEYVARTEPHTFGSALSRALALQAGQKGGER